MSTEAKPMGERMATVEEWIEGHEQRCEDRQLAMGREIGQLRKSLGGLTNGAWGVAGAVILQLLALAAFLFAKLIHLS